MWLVVGNSLQKAINVNKAQGIGWTSPDPLLVGRVRARDYFNLPLVLQRMALDKAKITFILQFHDSISKDQVIANLDSLPWLLPFFWPRGGLVSLLMKLTNGEIFPGQHFSTNYILNVSHTFTLMTTGAFSWNIGKLFSELKLVIDNLLFIYAEANWEATESHLRYIRTNLSRGRFRVR